MFLDPEKPKYLNTPKEVVVVIMGCLRREAPIYTKKRGKNKMNQHIQARLNATNIYNMLPAEQINNAISRLPVAQLCDIDAKVPKSDGLFDTESVKNFKVVRVKEHNGRVSYVDAPTGRYRIIQHEKAFRPVIEGLTQAGVKDFSFVINSNPRTAQMQVYVDSAGYDSVSLGFKVGNSFDRTKALSFGFSLNKSQKYIEVVGYRQVCSNGLVVRVPLENAEFIKEEARIKLVELVDKKTKIKHTENASEKLQLIQYVVEALALLREPVERMIKAGQAWKINHEELLEQLVKAHVTKRYQKRVIAQYNKQVADGEGNDLWQLTNAITWVASHDSTLKDKARETLLGAGADLLLESLPEVN